MNNLTLLLIRIDIIFYILAIVCFCAFLVMLLWYLLMQKKENSNKQTKSWTIESAKKFLETNKISVEKTVPPTPTNKDDKVATNIEAKSTKQDDLNNNSPLKTVTNTQTKQPAKPLTSLQSKNIAKPVANIPNKTVAKPMVNAKTITNVQPKHINKISSVNKEISGKK